MFTVIVYWNAKVFTRYERVQKEDFVMHEGYVEILQKEKGREIIIPWSTINRIELEEM